MTPEIENPSRLRIGLAGAGHVVTSQSAVTVGDRRVPKQMKALFSGAEGQPSLILFIEVINGVPRLTSLHIDRVDGGRELRQKDLRALADLDSWVEAIVARCCTRILEERDEGDRVTVVSVMDGSMRDSMRVISAARRGSRRALTGDVLRRIADTYNAADHYGLEDVQQVFEVSRSTAARYIRAAREAGLIEGKSK